MTDAQPETVWTSPARDQLLAAADAVADAVKAHAAAVAAASSTTDEDALYDAGDPLRDALDAYAEAQFAYSETLPPYDVDTDDEDEHVGVAEPAIADADITGVTIVQRLDFRIVNRDAVMTAGKAAEAEIMDDDAPGPDEVSPLARALYANAHLRRGWNNLGDVPGIDPVAGITLALANDDLLPNDPEQWPDEPLTIEDGEVIYTEGNTWVD